MSEFSFTDHSHRRFNPLTQSWVLCSPHRAKRPWLGQTEEQSTETRPPYDPKCYLCPGNTRATGTRNEKYTSTCVFTNDYAAVHENQPMCTNTDIEQVTRSSSNDLFRVESVCGTCKVVCFSPRHDLTLPELSVEEIIKVVCAWQQVYADLSRNPEIKYVQLFENKGAVMGCSNPHPHGQAWALSHVPTEPAQEISSFRAYQKKHNACILCTYVEAELVNSKTESTNRIIVQNESFMVVVPFWATWPFETMIVAKSHVSSISEMSDAMTRDLASAIRELTIRYDNLFECSFPYSMGLHQAPTATHEDGVCCHLHLHFYPPLLRSKEVRKFLVGFEMMAEPQRDLTAEQAASRLRALSSVHYKSRV
ncbi:galactose-1-phosphate uridyl transferase [Coemansia sp. RSA 2523]|nr:galactose-1-phosphate uridyl transferase [Coemansia sp. RSA 1824]KAJ1811072.1 galactose-1-phosphate uridyl transferase [Coemansia sp. RSA 2523]KAJ2127517.1 galactose-1-phosphate uridyl transferase [Coemansia sp. RSA 921]KAJ2135561.1 galactose-1-phosphate uridyl transferase [Coemansia sp. RSA 788]KAJ2155047.1 galactose-1-phosphate uridyl transferase [Coemansia sp. RSA 637]KAJ2169725.1 galactose-1-phosphate uridyl transferase [Coemansia sp. RSA 562]KAJ2182779.1 galactose-1-phosphate uridyl t